MPEHDSPHPLDVEYVLSELDERSRAHFEERLAASDPLRAEIQKLETACEALALSAPQHPPPRRVLRNLARLTEESRPPTHGLAWARAWRWLFASGWAVCLLMLGIWTARERTRATSAPAGGDALAVAGPAPIAASPASSAPPAAPVSPVSGATPEPILKAPVAPSQEEARRLRGWVRQLATEVADLHRALERQSTFPPGTTRFQVFRLAGIERDREMVVDPPTVPPETAPDAGARVRAAIDEWLAMVIARQLLGAVTGVPEGSHSGSNPQTLAANPSDPDSWAPSGASTASLNLAENSGGPVSAFEVTALETDSIAGQPDVLAAVTGQNPAVSGYARAVGFYTADSGAGGMALYIGNGAVHAIEGASVHFWAFDHGGQHIRLGEIPATEAFTPLYVQFTIQPDLLVNPGFMVTLEPRSSADVPSGTVLIGPPPDEPPAP